MALKTYNPTSPSMRQLVTIDRSELHKGKPVKTLTEGLSSSGGRNNHGRITTRFRGGGHKRTYRLVDFKRRGKWGVAATVERLEYDPNRTAFIALVKYEDGELAYILAPQRLQVGDKVIAADRVDVKPGNAAPLKSDPGRHDHPQCRAEARRRRPDGALGRLVRAADRPRRRLEPDPPGLGRDPPGPLRVHGLDRRRLEPRPPEHQLRQGRADALEGPEAAQSRCHHEPGRPSARRRRGPHLGWPASGEPVGPADQGPQDQAQQEDRPA